MTQTIDARLNPDEAVAAAEKAVARAYQSDTDTDAAPPLMEDPPNNRVTLPGGIVHEDHGTLTTAKVKELLGEDEEELSRVKDMTQFKNALLSCGVETLGEGIPASKELLNRLFIGDREFLLLQLRIVSFGKEAPAVYRCDNCEYIGEVELDLHEDVPIRAGEPEGEVRITLPDGNRVLAYLATGEEEVEADRMMTSGDTSAEANTYILGNCIQRAEHIDPWMGASSAKKLPMRDRRVILNELSDGQPGPRFDEIKKACKECGAENTPVLSLVNLFRY